MSRPDFMHGFHGNTTFELVLHLTCQRCSQIRPSGSHDTERHPDLCVELELAPSKVQAHGTYGRIAFLP